KSFLSTRPRSHAERILSNAFAGGIATAGLHPSVVASLAAYFPVAAVYEAARVANEAAATKVAQDSDRQHAPSDRLTSAFRGWNRAIDDANDRDGYAAATLAPELDGATPTAFLKLPDAAKVARLVTLFAHVDATPSLVGDPADYEAVKGAADVLVAAI